MEAVETAPLEWGDEGYFDEDDTFEDELDLKTQRNRTSDVHPPEKSVSVASQLPDENKTMRSKTSHPAHYGYPQATFKRDPAVDVIIESRKSILVENAYTRLAQTTSQRARSSQQTRMNSFITRPTATEKQPETDPALSEHDKRPALIQLAQLDPDIYDDGLNGDFDKGISVHSVLSLETMIDVPFLSEYCFDR